LLFDFCIGYLLQPALLFPSPDDFLSVFFATQTQDDNNPFRHYKPTEKQEGNQNQGGHDVNRDVLQNVKHSKSPLKNVPTALLHPKNRLVNVVLHFVFWYKYTIYNKKYAI